MVGWAPWLYILLQCRSVNCILCLLGVTNPTFSHYKNAMFNLSCMQSTSPKSLNFSTTKLLHCSFLLYPAARVAFAKAAQHCWNVKFAGRELQLVLELQPHLLLLTLHFLCYCISLCVVKEKIMTKLTKLNDICTYSIHDSWTLCSDVKASHSACYYNVLVYWYTHYIHYINN
jgi:hypothetical protein